MGSRIRPGFRATRSWVGGIRDDRELFAFTKIAWEHATRADVHPVELAFGSAALYALLRWERTLITRDLAWSAFAFAAALCVHSAAVLLLPGLFILAVGKIELIRPCRRRTLAYEASVENARTIASSLRRGTTFTRTAIPAG